MRASFPLIFFISAAAAMAESTAPPSTPTFHREILPILQNNCQGCHRAGEAGPMPLMTYKEVRPFAAAIGEAVELKKMPPWFADPAYGHFSNDRSMNQQDIDTIVAWVKAGAPEGDAEEAPPPKQFVDGWNIAAPDLVLTMPAKFNVPAKSTIDYQYALIPTHFDHDTWVQAAEVRPGDRTAVHHVIAYVREPGSKWMPSLKVGQIRAATKDDGDQDREFLVGYAPGLPAISLPPGRAKLIKAGSDIIFELHYTATGKAAVDQTKIGLKFATTPVKERIWTAAGANDDFEIPPGNSNYQVEADVEFAKDTRMVDLLPHMHLRGKDFEYVATYPTGEKQVLLNVPHYSFSWQLTYYPEKDIVIPKGTKLHLTAHYDNSANNPFNPDPTKKVTWGDQSWDEMMIGFFDLVVPRDADVQTYLVHPDKKKTDTASSPEKKAVL